MTPARLTRILSLIDSATSAEELAGLRWGFQMQGEWTAEVIDHFTTRAVRAGWWPVKEYCG